MSKTIKLTIDMEWVQEGCARIAKDCFEWVRDTEQDKTFDDIGYVTNRADIAYMCTNPKNAKEFGVNVKICFTKEEYINTVLYMYKNKDFNIPYLNTWANLEQHLSFVKPTKKEVAK